MMSAWPGDEEQRGGTADLGSSATLPPPGVALSWITRVVFVLWLAYRGAALVLDRFRLAHGQEEWFREQQRLVRA
jgi:hypothetical protein